VVVELALAILGGGSTLALAAFVITQAIWLHSANRERDNLRDTLDAEQTHAQKWRSKYETELATHQACIKQRDTEHNLRVIAESQRNEAQRKCRAYLARNILGATNDELNEILGDLFSAPLSVVPKPGAAEADRDTLLNPYTGEV
jgi:hypothetical protein